MDARGARRYRRLFHFLGRRTRPIEADVDDEIGLHLELRVEQLVRRGLAPDEARREALRRFGDVDVARHEITRIDRGREARVRGREWLDGVWQDVRYAARGVRRAPGVALMIVLTLGLGIGANAAMFGIVDRLLLRGPERVRDADRVTRLYVTQPSAGGTEFFTGSTVGYVLYANMRDHARAFERVAAYAVTDATLGEGDAAERVRSGAATWDFFPLLGVRPQLGRFFGAEEDRPPAGERVAVLGYGLWRRAFAGDPAAVGRTLTLNDETYTIVGVAPRGFTGVELGRVDVWVPMSVRSNGITNDWPTSWNAQWLQVVARLKPGVTPEQAGADATAAHRRTYAGEDKDWTGARLSVAPLRYNRQGKESPEAAVSRWLVGVATVVLLIVCANVANLLLARAVRRQREVAVRLALGVRQGRLVRLLLAETVLLGLAGGAAALAVAHWGGRAVRTLLLPDVDWGSMPTVDGRVLAFTAAAALATGVLVGLVPALQAGRADLTTALRSGAREGGGRGAGLRTGLTVAQSALSVVLLVGAGLFVRSLHNINALDLGIEPARVTTVSPSWPTIRRLPQEARTAERARRDAVVDAALERVRLIPGVEQASVAVGTPFNSSFGINLRVEGHDSIPTLAGGGPYVSAVSSGYFATVGTRLLRGRAFTPADRAGSERVAVVNATMARTLWPNAEAIGRCLYLDSLPCSRIVGVVADARRFQLREKAAMQYFVPLGQESGIGGRALLVRPRGPSPGAGAALAPLIRAELRRLDPSIGFVAVKTLQESVDPQIRPWRLGATMFGVFGALALAVAAIGLYSVIAYGVAQRTRELGVRLALGAQRGSIVRLVVRQAMAATAAGLALGTGGALLGGRYLEPLLFETSARSPAVFAAVAAALLAVGVLASLVPARRATRVDPVTALRAE